MGLVIDSVELWYGEKKILYGIYLEAKVGEVTGILGRNGAGKTSLLNIIFGSINPKYYSLRIDDRHQKRKLYKTGQVAYLPQHKFIPGDMPMKRAFYYFNASWEEFTTIFPVFMPYGNVRISTLSSGERRVAETYLVMKSTKKIILLDEPFSFVAPLYVEKFKEILQGLHEKLVIISDHFYHEIIDVSHSLYLLRQGCSKKINGIEDLEREGYLVNRQ